MRKYLSKKQVADLVSSRDGSVLGCVAVSGLTGAAKPTSQAWQCVIGNYVKGREVPCNGIDWKAGLAKYWNVELDVVESLVSGIRGTGEWVYPAAYKVGEMLADECDVS